MLAPDTDPRRGARTAPRASPTRRRDSAPSQPRVHADRRQPRASVALQHERPLRTPLRSAGVPPQHRAARSGSPRQMPRTPRRRPPHRKAITALRRKFAARNESPQRRDVGSISSARAYESQQRLVRDRRRRDVAGRGVFRWRRYEVRWWLGLGLGLGRQRAGQERECSRYVSDVLVDVVVERVPGEGKDLHHRF
jgi:hypothetical protein